MEHLAVYVRQMFMVKIVNSPLLQLHGKILNSHEHFYFI